MNWLKRKGSKRPEPLSNGEWEAHRAVAREEEKLREVHAETSEIMEAVERLKALGTQNDFARKIYKAMGGA